MNRPLNLFLSFQENRWYLLGELTGEQVRNRRRTLSCKYGGVLFPFSKI